MGLYLLHVCKGDKIVADAGAVDVAAASAAIAAGVLVAKELSVDQRFLLSAVIVTDDTSKVVAKVPVWSMARSRICDRQSATTAAN